MKPFFKLLSVIALLCISGCNTANLENLTKASNEIATYCNSQNVRVSTSTGISTGDKDMDAYTVEINDLKVVDGYPLSLVASHAAKILYDRLNDEQRKDKNIIRVMVSTTSKSETNDYIMADMARIGSFIKKGRLMVDYIKKADYNSLGKSLDKKYFTKENYEAFLEAVLKKNKDILSKTDTIQDDGFETAVIDGKNFINVYSHTPIDTLNVRYRFTFTDAKPPKLAGIQIK